MWMRWIGKVNGKSLRVICVLTKDLLASDKIENGEGGERRSVLSKGDFQSLLKDSNEEDFPIEEGMENKDPFELQQLKEWNPFIDFLFSLALS